MTTPRLGGAILTAAQAIPESTVNQLVRLLEQGAMQFSVEDKDLAAPPGSPADGAAYIVAASPTGAWSGKAEQIAWQLAGSGWQFIAPIEGMKAWARDENATYVYDGADWVPDSAFGGVTLDTDGTLSANSDARIASQKAVKTYVDTAVVGLLDYKGATDCSADPNYPAALKGDAYVVSVAGKIGGASGITVERGDFYFAKADNAGGTQAGVGSSWDVLQTNLINAAMLSGATFTGAVSVPDDGYSGSWNGSAEVPTKNAVYDALDAFSGGASTGISALAGSDDAMWFGDGSDGALTISSGTTTITRDMFYNDLTISSSGKMNTSGYRVHVLRTLDISAAGVDAIFANAQAGVRDGTDSVANAQGSGGSGTLSGTETLATSGSGGGNGGTGGTGAGAQAAAAGGGSNCIGSNGGASGKGGDVGATAGGASRAVTAFNTTRDLRRLTYECAVIIAGTYTRILGGGGGPGGGSGAGGGAGDNGGGGGGGGAGGGLLWLAARTIHCSGSTAAGAITARGGNGGVGGLGTGGINRGGGGGGSGGGGGWLILIYRFLTGIPATGAADASGGKGGAGANGTGTGLGGNGGAAGGGGRIHRMNLGTGVFTILNNTAAVAGNAASGIAGGAQQTNNQRLDI